MDLTWENIDFITNMVGILFGSIWTVIVAINICQFDKSYTHIIPYVLSFLSFPLIIMFHYKTRYNLIICRSTFCAMFGLMIWTAGEFAHMDQKNEPIEGIYYLLMITMIAFILTNLARLFAWIVYIRSSGSTLLNEHHLGTRSRSGAFDEETNSDM